MRRHSCNCSPTNAEKIDERLRNNAVRIDISLGGSRRTVAYSLRSVRPGYMLTTPAVGRGWQRDGTGGTPGVATPAGPGRRTGESRQAVGNHTALQIPSTYSVGLACWLLNWTEALGTPEVPSEAA